MNGQTTAIWKTRLIGSVSLAVCVLFLVPQKAAAQPLDLHDDGEYCSALAAKRPTFSSKYMTPTWVAEPKISAALEPNELDSIAHNLNSDYLRSMVDSTYLRLNAAKESGLDFKNYKKAFAAMAQYCAKPDLSGHSLALEAGRIARLPNEVEADFAGFNLDGGDPKATAENYLRRLTVAAIETRRIHALLNDIKVDQNNVKPDAFRAEQIKVLTMVHLLRLVRLQHRYPVLVSVGTFFGATSIEVGVESAMGPDLSLLNRPLGSEFFSDETIEGRLGLNPAGTESAAMPPVRLLTQTQEEPGARTFYRNLYSDILSGRRPIPDFLKERLLTYIDLSVRESISSATLKCQNVSPCRAIATHPLLAAAKIDRAGKNDDFGPMACACHIGQQHQWMTNSQNLGISLASASAVLIATVYPVNWVVILAYGLAAADAGGIVAGLNDNYKNVSRTNQVALFRAGGAVPPLYEFDIQNDYANQKYGTVVSLITSALSLAPPGRILARPAGSTARDMVRTHEFIVQSKMEFGKASLSIPPPDTGWKAYQASTDPRRDLAPISQLLRLRYPKFAEELDAAASSSSDLSLRDRDFRIARMKADARARIAAGQTAEN